MSQKFSYSELVEQAGRGDSEAMYQLGLWRLRTNILIDRTAALNLFEQAAAVGHLKAKAALERISKEFVREKGAADAYAARKADLPPLETIEVTADIQSSLQSEAEKGNPDSMARLSDYLFSGFNGFDQDVDAAMYWLGRAVFVGNSRALWLYGRRLFNGWMYPKDESAGLMHIEKAASKGNLDAIDFLIFYEVEHDCNDKDTVLMDAARAGDLSAIRKLARMYEMGDGVVQSSIKAKGLFDAASRIENKTRLSRQAGVTQPDDEKWEFESPIDET